MLYMLMHFFQCPMANVIQIGVENFKGYYTEQSFVTFQLFEPTKLTLGTVQKFKKIRYYLWMIQLNKYETDQYFLLMYDNVDLRVLYET